MNANPPLDGPWAQAVEDRVRRILEAAAHPLAADELAEVVWLEALLRSSQQPEPEPPVQGPKPAAPAASPEAPPPPELPPKPNDKQASKGPPRPKQPVRLGPSAPEPAPIPSANLLPNAALPMMEDVSEMVSQLTTLPVWLEDPPLLGDPLTVLRGLGRLREGVESGTRFCLDEEETVDAFARTLQTAGHGGLLVPVLKPLLEPRFDLCLVVDAGLSMVLWDRLILDLKRMFSGCGGFRRLRVVPLVEDESQRQIANRFSVDDPEHRQLVLVLTDCGGPQWRQGDVWACLERWSRTAPTAILQVLPRWLWKRSALGLGEPVSLRNSQPVAPTHRYLQRPIQPRQPASRRHSPILSSAYGPNQPNRNQIAVLTCEPADLALWSCVVMGDSRYTMSGIAMATPFLSGDGVTPSDSPPSQAAPGDANLPPALRQFTDFATPQARELLRLLAAAPVLTLPVMRMVKRALMVSDQTPLAMAEVLLSGVLEQLTPNSQSEQALPVEQWQFDFRPGIRDRLLEVNSVYDTVTVVNAVTKLVEQRWNRFSSETSFQAFLSDPFAHPPAGLDGLQSFARVAATIIERLGGDYTHFAEQLKRGARKAVRIPWPDDQFTFEDLEVESAQIISLPEVESVSFQTAEFALIPLKTIEFSTALLEGGAPVVSEGTTAGFLEHLQQSAAANEARSDRANEVASPGVSGLTKAKTMVQNALTIFNTGVESDPNGTPAPPSSDSGVVLEMLSIPAGSFLMGSPENEDRRFNDEGPQHAVSLSAFFLSRTPITQAQWRAVAEWEPLADEEPWPQQLDPNPVAKLNRAKDFLGDQRPVVNVSWKDAMEFCHRLRVRTGKHYTLPSEAQWEYACRAGTTTPFHFGATLSTDLANYNCTYTYGDGRKGKYRRLTTDVGTFPANAWGLHDMHGNVWEWCADHWHENYAQAPVDGRAWLIEPTNNGDAGAKFQDKEERRLLRGGSWNDFPGVCRSAYRSRNAPVIRNISVGFRVCCLPQDLILYP